jgi:hypothetical protein
MRNIEYTYQKSSGALGFIFKIEGLKFRSQNLVAGAVYEIEYKLGARTQSIRSVYFSATDNFRTIIVQNPESLGATIGIPSMNILSMERVA